MSTTTTKGDEWKEFLRALKQVGLDGSAIRTLEVRRTTDISAIQKAVDHTYERAHKHRIRNTNRN
jgi:sugar phosphate isomerase/epimerase